MKSLIIMALCLCSFSVFADSSKSELPAWAKEDSRTQGGGWIWFPANATAKTEQEADRVARGKALVYLRQECLAIPKETKFHERFSIKKNNKFHVYVRASVKQNDCRFIKSTDEDSRHKYVNKELHGVFMQYSLEEAKSRVNYKQCNYMNIHCVDQSIEALHMRDDFVALLYAQYSCEKGEIMGCQSAAKLLDFISKH